MIRVFVPPSSALQHSRRSPASFFDCNPLSATSQLSMGQRQPSKPRRGVVVHTEKSSSSSKIKNNKKSIKHSNTDSSCTYQLRSRGKLADPIPHSAVPPPSAVPLPPPILAPVVDTDALEENEQADAPPMAARDDDGVAPAAVPSPAPAAVDGSVAKKKIRLVRKLRNGGVRDSLAENNIQWKGKEDVKLQQKYDRGHYGSHLPRRLRSVWRSALGVRHQLQQSGNDQTCLRRGKNALHVSGIIYAIVSSKSQRVYVGQTIHSALHRFHQHVAHARKGEMTPLHVHIRKVGLHAFYLIPLEKIPTSHYMIHGNHDVNKFRSLANDRERHWIERLHAYQPRGFNVEYASRKRAKRNRTSKKMCWAKDKSESEEKVERFIPPLAPPSSARPPAPAPAPRRPYQFVPSPAYLCQRQFGYRNFVRRCIHLLSLYRRDPLLLQKVNWSHYLARNLWRLLGFFKLEANKQGWDPDAVNCISDCINQHLLIRPKIKAAEKSQGKPCIALEWTSNLLRSIPLRKFLQCTASRESFPGDSALLGEVRVAKKLSEPLGRSVFNYSAAARKLFEFNAMLSNKESNDAAALPLCPCHSEFNAEFRPNGGCVFTGDVGIVSSTSLRRLLAMGAKLRVHTASDPLDAVKQALESFIDSCSQRDKIAKEEFSHWRATIVDMCNEKLSKLNSHAKIPPSESVASPSPSPSIASAHVQRDLQARLSLADLKYLRQLQHFLVLVPVDKAANNIAFICKREYTRILRGELNSSADATAASSVYEVSKESESAVRLRHTKLLSCKYKIPNPPNRLAFLYWIPKLHKNPPSHRFIAAAFDCTTTSLSKILSDCLTSVLATLRQKDDAQLVHTAIRRFFVVDGYEEVASFLNRWPRSSSAEPSKRQLRSGDFSTMYTTIPHDDLELRLSQVMDEVWKWKVEEKKLNSDHQVALRWTTDDGGQCEWVSNSKKPLFFDHSPRVHVFTKRELLQATVWLVSNTYLVNGGVCRRQRVGIPMGTNCAPAIANLYLYSYESQYMDQLIANNSKLHACAFHMTFRLIDDVLSVDNPFFIDSIAVPFEAGGMYPAALTLNDTTISSGEVHFLGMSIRDFDQERKKFTLDVFDKRREFPFAVCRYPQRASLLPSAMAYGTFTGLLHRYYRICSAFDGFHFNSTLLADTLLKQGWRPTRLKGAYRCFLQSRFSGLKWKQTSLSEVCRLFSQHIQTTVRELGIGFRKSRLPK
jgi:hypothetical protein